jgi:hypothetical protein
MAGSVMHREAPEVVFGYLAVEKEPRAWPAQRNGAWCEHATFGFPLLSLS